MRGGGGGGGTRGGGEREEGVCSHLYREHCCPYMAEESLKFCYKY